MRYWIFIAVLAASLEVRAEIPVEHFAKHPEYRDVVISPTGKYLAVEMRSKEGNDMVAILKMADMSIASYIPAAGKEAPFNITWVNDERVVVQIMKRYGSLVRPFANGQLFAMNADGNDERMLIEHQETYEYAAPGKRPDNKLSGHAELDNLLPKDPDHVLINFLPRGLTSREKPDKLYRLNVYTGKAYKLAISPAIWSRFITDNDGNLLYNVGVDINHNNDVVVHKWRNKDWELTERIPAGGDGYSPVSVNADGRTVIMLESSAAKTQSLFALNVETKEKVPLFQHPEVDPTHWDYDNSGQLYAVHFDAPYPDVHLTDSKHPCGRWYPALFKAFNGQRAIITSATRGCGLLTVRVDSDSDPGQFYLFNSEAKQLGFLLDSESWLDRKQLAKTKAFQFVARDGMEVNGYLTLPVGKEAKNLPMVVMPHGGPHGVRDYWEYSSDVQFLASRGYAVLQVNFRGSGGYGNAFMDAGYRNWGAGVQYDIIDATRWAVKEKAVDSKRICIYGASFGGYSALMSATIESELYRCAIGYVGVYDLNLLWSKGDIQKLGYGENYLRQAIGEDKEQLTQFSPVYQVDKLKAPVLLIHGKEDERAPVEHFDAMVKALKKAKHPYETMLVKHEAHGFYDEKNEVMRYKRMQSFLKKHIGD